jgi:hypothetical protein
MKTTIELRLLGFRVITWLGIFILSILSLAFPSTVYFIAAISLIFLMIYLFLVIDEIKYIKEKK